MSNSYPNEAFIKNFYERIVLGKENFPALKPFWFVEFEIPTILDGVYNNFKANSNYLVTDPILWEINNSYDFNLDNVYNNKVKYLIQGITVPGDGLENDYSSTPVNSSYIKGRIGNGRKNFDQVTISFMENNASIIDFLIRPWITMVSYLSLKHSGIKTNLHVTQLQKDENGFKVRKVYNFFKAVPVSVDDEDYTYEAPNAIITRVSKWVFNSYNMEDRKDPQEWSEDNNLTVKNRIPKPTTFALPEQQIQEPTWASITNNVLTDLKQTAENLTHIAAGELTKTFEGTTGQVIDAVAGGNLVNDLITGEIGLKNLQIPLISDTPSPVEVYAKSKLTEVVSNALSNVLGTAGQKKDVPEPITSSDISVESNSTINNVKATDISVIPNKTINSVDVYDKKVQKSTPILIRSSDAANPGKDTSQYVAIPDIKIPNGDTSTNWDIKGKIINTKDVVSDDLVVNDTVSSDVGDDTPVQAGSSDTKQSTTAYSDVPSSTFQVPDKSINKNDIPSVLLNVKDKQINKIDVVKSNIIKGIIVTNKNDVVVNN